MSYRQPEIITRSKVNTALVAQGHWVKPVRARGKDHHQSKKLTEVGMSSSSVVEDFFAFPSEILLESDKKLKETLIKGVKSALSERGVLEVRAQAINPEECLSSPLCDDDQTTKFSEMSLQEKQLCIDAEKLCAEGGLCFKRELENDFEIKKLQPRLELRKIELQFEKEREEREFQLRKLELELKVKTDQTTVQVSSGESVLAPPVFDVYKNIRLVPPFLEKEVEKYFQHFERVAESLKWPKEFWTLLLQCVLVGRAQEVYSASTTEQSADYEIVKPAILHAYELAPEAYRQKFRTHSKSEKCTYLEFAREKENLFDRWRSSVKISTKEQLRELILLEEFKSCVPNAVVM
ncbi:Zinc finger and SCAN domain-containing protein 25 [Labeo rohita]|uniref:Zinc finger and SCAN domain-containing protein 25 n=1 Tax=Labeo rohita TaxID=84645 RepID=A0ABQ8L8U2_LABRO|nr:Zinc finger and SCAN domain-containing protein 25 [Labeo rohita]